MAVSDEHKMGRAAPLGLLHFYMRRLSEAAVRRFLLQCPGLSQIL